MTPDDLARLHAQAFETPRPWRAEEFAALLESPHCFALYRPHGFLIGRAIAGEAELLTLATAPAQRRQGIGNALVDAFEDAARKRGATTAFLEVAAPNVAARALYAQHGYEQVGHRPAYYSAPDGSRVDALVLQKFLAPT